ncbi:MAG: hypothetical protein QM831_38335 [Kofleriaceae bacterium]
MRWWVLVALAACQREPSNMDNAGGSASTSADCPTVVVRVQQAVQSQIDQVGDDARVMIAKMMPAMKDACVEDHWPKILTDCIVQSKPGDLAALTKCNQMMGRDLQDKLQARMLKLQPLKK